jgi:hypothetical protein
MYVNFNKEKEEKTMKYETPKLSTLTPAINAIQSGDPMLKPQNAAFADSPSIYLESVQGYMDWE